MACVAYTGNGAHSTLGMPPPNLRHGEKHSLAAPASHHATADYSG